MSRTQFCFNDQYLESLSSDYKRIVRIHKLLLYTSYLKQIVISLDGYFDVKIFITMWYQVNSPNIRVPRHQQTIKCQMPIFFSVFYVESSFRKDIDVNNYMKNGKS